MSSVDFNPFSEKLIVRNQPGTYVNAIYVFYKLFCPRDGLEVFTLSYYCPHNTCSVCIWYSLKQNVRCHYRYAESSYSVCLHRESPFAWHCLYDSLYLGTGLHCLVRGKITYISCTYCKYLSSEHCKLLVHHPLNYGSCVYSRQVIVLKCWHKWNSSGGYHEMLRIYITNLLFCNVFNNQSFSLKYIPYNRVQ